MCKLKIYQESEYVPLVLVFDNPIAAAEHIESMAKFCKTETRFELVFTVGEEEGDE